MFIFIIVLIHFWLPKRGHNVSFIRDSTDCINNVNLILKCDVSNYVHRALQQLLNIFATAFKSLWELVMLVFKFLDHWVSLPYLQSVFKHFLLLVFLDISFTLSEVAATVFRRLFFTRGDPTDIQYEGTFELSGPNITAERTITVYAVVS